jgi:hypothetical protein
MLSPASKNSITLKTEKNSHKLKFEEYTRWLCLVEALNIITKKAGQLNVDLHNKDVDWIKPLSFQKYITERFDSMVEEVEMYENVKFAITKIPCATLSEPVSE